MARGSNSNQTNTDSAVRAASDERQWAKSSAQGAGQAANDVIYNEYLPRVNDLWKNNPWQDPTYLSNLRSKVATAASGTENNFEEKANENLKKTGGLNTAGTLADLDEARREKTRTMNSELKDQYVQDYNKDIGLKGQLLNDYSTAAGMFNSRIGPYVGGASSATGDISKLGEPHYEQSFWDQLALAGIGAAGAVGAGFAGKPPTGGCWIAEAVYGVTAPETDMLRAWLNLDFGTRGIGRVVLAAYLRYGQTVAKFVQRNRVARWAAKYIFDRALPKARAWAYRRA